MRSQLTLFSGFLAIAIWMLPACQSGSESSTVPGETSGAGVSSTAVTTVDPEDFPPGSFGEQLAAVLQQPSPQGKIFPLQQIKFAEGGVIFTPDCDLQALNELARIMKANPRMVVEVSAFAAAAPPGANIERFALSRSYFIKNHLINEGVIKVNIETKGFEANEYNTEAGQAKERVEIRILGI